MLRWLRLLKYKLVYEAWIDDIVLTEKPELLLRHFHKHVSEAETDGMSEDWLASMYNLVEIARRGEALKKPSIARRLMRLIVHWHMDPENSTHPPWRKLFEPSSQFEEKVERDCSREMDWAAKDAEMRLGKPRPAPKFDYTSS